MSTFWPEAIGGVLVVFAFFLIAREAYFWLRSIWRRRRGR